MAQLEQNKAKDIEEMLEEFNTRKKQGLAEIKEKFNSLAQQVKIDASQVKEAFKIRKMKQEEERRKSEDIENIQVEVNI